MHCSNAAVSENESGTPCTAVPIHVREQAQKCEYTDRDVLPSVVNYLHVTGRFAFDKFYAKAMEDIRQRSAITMDLKFKINAANNTSLCNERNC